MYSNWDKIRGNKDLAAIQDIILTTICAMAIVLTVGMIFIGIKTLITGE